ncbi:MAG TPA: bifunctional helix-turn-helix transcriptional regulator/GNAT family N-acetyltransferase [Patescibacteria group bacterium]|nr:bifunctional helix-turn-helix transcriptional regulator/GNAT family N-acetyltransferase [Patescibacteria group bacterium]
MAFLQEKREVALATRLKALSEILMRDVKKFYDVKKIEFEPRWFSIIYLLTEKGEMALTEIAKEVLQSHAAVNQTVNILEKKGLVKSRKDGNDDRKRLLCLTPQGKKRVDDLQPLWADIFKANAELLRCTAPHFLKELTQFERALAEKSMFERICELGQKTQPQILLKRYSTVLKEHFYTLNKQWLEEYFEMEASDKEALTQPEKLLKEKNAEIYFAEFEDTVAGTFCLIPQRDNCIEFSKFAVDTRFRKRGIGTFLLNSAIARASEHHAQKLVLYTSPVLVEACNLYISKGFLFTENDRQHFYKRSTIKMELTLTMT